MKKLILMAFVSVLAFGFEMQAQAKIQFKTDTIDYGTIAKGSDGLRIFEFTNTGNQPLVITEVFSSCGCTVPKKPDEPIAPGKTGKIEVKYDTSRVGPIRKTITVNNNSDTPIVALKIKGEVTN